MIHFDHVRVKASQHHVLINYRETTLKWKKKIDNRNVIIVAQKICYIVVVDVNIVGDVRKRKERGTHRKEKEKKGKVIINELKNIEHLQ